MHLTNNQENLHVLEQIVEQTGAVFFIYEINSKHFRYISPAFKDIWERDRLEFGQYPVRILDTIHPEDIGDLQRTWEKIHQRINKTQEFRIFTPGGHIKFLDAETFNILNENGTYSVAGFIRDISEAKERDFTLLKYTSKKNSTLEILSHDLMGPLNIIKQVAELVKESTSELPDKTIESDLSLIQETCQRSINLIRDLVNKEFLESEESGFKKERLDLVEKIGIVVDNYRQSERAISKNFNFAFTTQPIFAEIDDVKFMQVINNLISNSIKFTPDGGTINVFVSEEDEEIEIAIEDNGVGIPRELQPYLFERFTKARRPGLRGENPIGLGLSIIKNMVELHQGRIWFDSQENKGSTFYIRIPKI